MNLVCPVFSQSLSQLIRPSLIFSSHLCPDVAGEGRPRTSMGAWCLASVKKQLQHRSTRSLEGKQGTHGRSEQSVWEESPAVTKFWFCLWMPAALQNTFASAPGGGQGRPLWGNFCVRLLLRAPKLCRAPWPCPEGTYSVPLSCLCT